MDPARAGNRRVGSCRRVRRALGAVAVPAAVAVVAVAGVVVLGGRETELPDAEVPAGP